MEIDDGAPDAWRFREEREVELVIAERRAILFDRTSGFSWH